jgi:hypothetical protein
VVDSQNCVVKIREFSQLLGQPVTTIKRLFTNEVLNPTLVKKTAGKHWFICFSPDDRLKSRASIALWKVLHRKPRIARSYKVRDLLLSLAIDLVLSEEISSQRQSCRSPLKKVEAVKRALDLLRTRPQNVEAIWWYEQMLKFPEFAGTFILRVEIERFRAKYDRSPKRRELAETLNISERSLYRRPFGRGPLRHAYYGRRPADVDNEDVATDHQNESYTPESEEEMSREQCFSPRKNVLPVGFHEVTRQPAIKEKSRRKRRKRKVRSLELAWEEQHAGNIRGEVLLIFQSNKLEAKRRIEIIEQTVSGFDPKQFVRGHSRQLRHDQQSRAYDETFGSRGVGAYVIEPGGKYRWWTNFDASKGYADSAAQARCKILSAVARRTRFRIVNLAEMQAECRVEA